MENKELKSIRMKELENEDQRNERKYHLKICISIVLGFLGIAALIGIFFGKTGMAMLGVALLVLMFLILSIMQA